MVDSSVLVPLGVLDQNGVDSSGITLGYVLSTTSYDGTKLDAAAGRLAEKWRLLAGRLEYGNEMKTWCIRVPTGNLKGIKTHEFTSNVLNESLDVSNPVNTTSANITSRPALRYFRHGATPFSLAALSKQKAPILSIHISTLVNCTCVGISVPHGVFDATGLGQVIAGLNAELNGKPWECPGFSSENILTQKLEELRNADSSSSDEEPAFLAYTKYISRPINAINAARFLFSVGWEHLWHRVKSRAIYLGKDVVDLIVKEAKYQLKEGNPPQFISTGDVLVAWLLKTSQSDATSNDDPISVSSAMSIRSILSSSNPAFSTYTHNAIMICAMPPFTTSSVHASSIADIAVMHRSFLDTVRTPSFVQWYSRWMTSPETGGRVIPARPNMRSLVFSNQVIAGLSSLDLGSEQIMFWVWTPPITFYGICTINTFRGGYILQASSRKTEWVAIEREVERLKERVSKG